MMQVIELLASLAARGIRLIPDGDALVARPASKLTDADRQSIRAHMVALRARVRAEQQTTDEIAHDSRHPLICDAVRKKIEAIEADARAKGWPAELLWSSAFCDLPRGLAAMLEPGDEIGEVTSEFIEIWKLRRDRLRYMLRVSMQIDANALPAMANGAGPVKPLTVVPDTEIADQPEPLRDEKGETPAERAQNNRLAAMDADRGNEPKPNEAEPEHQASNLGQHPSDYLRNDMGAAFDAHLEDYVGELIMEQRRLNAGAVLFSPFGDSALSADSSTKPAHGQITEESAGIAARNDDLDRAFGPNRDERESVLTEPFTKALEEIARVMRTGIATHSNHEWTRRSVQFHLRRAEEHLRLLRGGDQLQDHLSHAATRLLMALTLREFE
jgi:hypothetical protein